MPRYVIRTRSLAWVNPRPSSLCQMETDREPSPWEVWAVLCRCVILHFKPWTKVVECIWEGCVIITGLWRGLVFSDGLNDLPQPPCVYAVCEVIIDFLSICPFRIFDATGQIGSCCFEFYLLIWMLHIWSLAAQEPLLSSMPSGLHVRWWSWWLSNHQCTFWCKQSQFQCTPAGLCGCCRWPPL